MAGGSPVLALDPACRQFVQTGTTFEESHPDRKRQCDERGCVFDYAKHIEQVKTGARADVQTGEVRKPCDCGLKDVHRKSKTTLRARLARRSAMRERAHIES